MWSLANVTPWKTTLDEKLQLLPWSRWYYNSWPWVNLTLLYSPGWCVLISHSLSYTAYLTLFLCLKKNPIQYSFMPAEHKLFWGDKILWDVTVCRNFQPTLVVNIPETPGPRRMQLWLIFLSVTPAATKLSCTISVAFQASPGEGLSLCEIAWTKPT